MKQKRHLKILELIDQNDVETQEDLLEMLKKCGFSVTQATVSRDIRELNLTKLTTGSGRQKYVPFYDRATLSKDKYVRVLKDGFISMDVAMNLVVLQTVSGMASAVCAAIDALELSGIVGSVAGDDTIMCATKSEEAANHLKDELQHLIF
ncbi:MAG: arginine repressor [Lachnospiraceae bacterium]|nr:arginine repressor [Lachnospiraceae bacterium]